MPSWRFLAAALALAAYALLSHLLMVLAADRPWAIVVLLGPLLLGVFALGWQHRHVPSLLACAVAACGMGFYATGDEGLRRVEYLYVLQHAGFHLALGCVFGATLRHGATPLISAFALRVHGAVSKPMALYTRRVTLLWTAYFAAMVVLSFGLFVLAPWWLWSVFANLFTPLAAVSLFVGEYLLRYRLHPEFERSTLRQALNAYRDTPMVQPRRP
jgi:uncharacterized membrane protein